VSDGQHHTGFLPAGGQGHHLVHLLVDAPGLVDQGEGVVETLEPLGDGREDLKAGPAGGDDQLVGVLLHAGLEVGVQLHHPRRDAMTDTGLAFVSGDHDDLGALGPGEELIERQHGHQRRLALSPRAASTLRASEGASCPT
jgi:hypothetical protein